MKLALVVILSLAFLGTVPMVAQQQPVVVNIVVGTFADMTPRPSSTMLGNKQVKIAGFSSMVQPSQRRIRTADEIKNLVVLGLFEDRMMPLHGRLLELMPDLEHDSGFGR